MLTLNQTWGYVEPRASDAYVNGLQDRLRGLPLAGDSPDYIRGYLEEVLAEIDRGAPAAA